jgi:arsenate reductase
MKKKIYYLSTCSTWKRITTEIDFDDSFERQDIKTEKITQAQIEKMAALAGSYEKLFSRIARKYRELGLKEKTLTEQDYKNYILEEYTFLKRPVVIIGEEIFIGNSKKNLLVLNELVMKLVTNS